ncbi:MAG: hypothetical protein AAFN30_00395 [Actinomycetota bacterium]
MKLLIAGLIAVVAAVVAVLVTADGANTGFTSNAAAITFVGAVALGIERVLEIAWTLVGQSRRLGGWWPLDRVQRAARDFESAAEQLLAPLDDLEEGIESAKAGLSEQDAAAQQLQAYAEQVQSVRPRLQAQLDRARQLAPGSSRLSLVSAVAEEAAGLVNQTAANADAKLADIRRRMRQAQSGMNTALDVIDAFQDNPARRLASLIAGAFLGLVVAGLSELNLFVATLTDDGGGLDGPLGGPIGVALTGIVLGFGASPTHEIVKGLQRYKERKDPGVAIYNGAVAPGLASAAGSLAGGAGVLAAPMAGGGAVLAAPMAGGGAVLAAPIVDVTDGPEASTPRGGADADLDLREATVATAAAAPVQVVSLAPSVRRVRSTD